MLCSLLVYVYNDAIHTSKVEVIKRKSSLQTSFFNYRNQNEHYCYKTNPSPRVCDDT